MKPINMSKEELITTLQDILNLIEADDSFEGHLAYSIPEDTKAQHPFDVLAIYRTGNSRGQGGTTVIADYNFKEGEKGNEAEN